MTEHTPERPAVEPMTDEEIRRLQTLIDGANGWYSPQLANWAYDALPGLLATLTAERERAEQAERYAAYQYARYREKARNCNHALNKRDAALAEVERLRVLMGEALALCLGCHGTGLSGPVQRCPYCERVRADLAATEPGSGREAELRAVCPLCRGGGHFGGFPYSGVCVRCNGEGTVVVSSEATEPDTGAPASAEE